MRFKTFLKIVEIQTKIASLFPFIFGTLYALYRFKSLNYRGLILFFISLLFFDMTTTAINNLMDYKKARDENYRKNHNIIGIDKVPEWQVTALISLMLGIAIFTGILLVRESGFLVLILGALSFFFGIFYTFGPVPLSRMPLGEVFSGLLMGFVIPYIGVYIHRPELAQIILQQEQLILQINWIETLWIMLISAPFVLAISNLMLANNICDLEQDVKNDRYLLPYYIGRKNSLIIFRWSYYAMYFFIAAAIALRVLPWASLITLPLFIVHYRLGKAFTERQVKSETFVLSVKGLVLISLGYIAGLGGDILIKSILSVWQT